MIIEEGTKQDFKRCVLAVLGTNCCGTCFEPLNSDEFDLRLLGDTGGLVCFNCVRERPYREVVKQTSYFTG